jgi:hypothetical protein
MIQKIKKNILLDEYSKSMLNDIFFKQSFQTALDEGKGILLSLTLNHTTDISGHGCIVLITKKDKNHNIYVYDSSSDSSAELLKNELIRYFNKVTFTVSSLNQGYHIQQIQKDDIFNNIEMIKEDQSQELNLETINSLFIKKLKEIFDSMVVYDESKIDKDIIETFGKFFNLRVVYETFKYDNVI